MAVQEVTYYQAVCDGCKKVHDYGEYAAWSCGDGARDAAIDCEWVEVEDRLLCGECQTCPVCGSRRADLGEGYLICEDCDEAE